MSREQLNEKLLKEVARNDPQAVRKLLSEGAEVNAIIKNVCVDPEILYCSPLRDS
jgi:hypothetical protein